MVLDLGSGSGILSIMAAQLGARRVVGVEECGDLVRLSRRNVAANGFEHIVEIHHCVASELEPDELADVLVTETLGTWMTCEGIVQYCEDARWRLLKQGALIIPERGTQYSVLVESAELERLFTPPSYRGIDLSAVMELQDTASCLWSKRLGIRPSDLVYRELCAPFPVLSADFNNTVSDSLPSSQQTCVRTLEGRIHAVLDFWVVEDAQGRQLSTNPRARRCEPWAYARDVAWGNGFHLVAEEPPDDDTRWAVFHDTEVSEVPSGSLSMGANALHVCRGICLYHGHTGFVTRDGKAIFLSCTREEMLNEQRHVLGSTLHVSMEEYGTPGLDPSRPMVPIPMDVADDEKLVVTSLFHSDHRGAQHLLRRIRPEERR
uniref:Methyltransferase domain-containing protein n=1 Tax=Noctiluca scintillans TaxID=2966 RepID=A0A7S1FD22_NOCSC